MEKNYDGAIAFAKRWIDIIHKSEVTEVEAKAIIEESIYNFAEHFNSRLNLYSFSSFIPETFNKLTGVAN